MFKQTPLPDYIKAEIPKVIINELQKGDCWIAGGFLRDMLYNHYIEEGGLTILNREKRVIKDIDIFCSSEAVAERVSKVIAPDNWLYFGPGVSRYPFKLEAQEINLIAHKFFDTKEKLLEQFNFRCNMFATDGTTLIEHEYAWKDNVNNTLTINYFSNPVSFLFKMQKYTKKGFVMSRNKVAEMLVRIKLSDFDLSDSENWYEDNEDL